MIIVQLNVMHTTETRLLFGAKLGGGQRVHSERKKKERQTERQKKRKKEKEMSTWIPFEITSGAINSGPSGFTLTHTHAHRELISVILPL